MFLKRTSPNDCLPLKGRLSTFGDTQIVKVILPNDTQENQEKPCGTCDHIRNDPRYFESAHHKKRPDIIMAALDSLKKSYKKAKILYKLFYRQQKIHSQRREAIILVLGVMLHYMDLETLEIGFFNDLGDFIRLDIAKIASYANITLTRANRAIRDIHRAGYLTTIRQYTQLDDGRKIGKTAIRTLSQSLFRDLKIDHLSVFKAMEWKRKRNEKTLAKKNKRRLYALMASIKGVADKANHKSYSAIRRVTTLLEHTAQEVMTVINKIERQNE
jgi:hypothetical protein